MHPAQIPGTLFVLLVAYSASFYSNPGPVLLLLALGCAAGWYGFNEDQSILMRTWANAIALVLWGFAFALALTRIF